MIREVQRGGCLDESQPAHHRGGGESEGRALGWRSTLSQVCEEGDLKKRKAFEEQLELTDDEGVPLALSFLAKEKLHEVLDMKARGP